MPVALFESSSIPESFVEFIDIISVDSLGLRTLVVRVSKQSMIAVVFQRH
jgi:hypothetical protein